MSLLSRLVARVRDSGPMSVADYMAACLLDPTDGYYTTRDPLGIEGDFTTAPEISQMFGELVGLSVAQAWLDQGAPERFTLAELGPGRGTLMADLLRATAAVPGFGAAAQPVLVEASPPLRARQAETLAQSPLITRTRWIDAAADLPEDAPLFLVANEFFDALPVRQFQRTGEVWRERQIGLSGDALTFGLGGPVALPALDRFKATPDGGMVELCAPATAIMAEIARRIDAHGGAALIVDYGDWHSGGHTVQAVAGHAPVDPLANPGGADLTAHVDFEALVQAAPALVPSQMTPQGVFLERLGITPRAQALARGLAGPALETHIAAHRRLTHPEEMGTLFKVQGFVPHGVAMLPGLET